MPAGSKKIKVDRQEYETLQTVAHSLQDTLTNLASSLGTVQDPRMSSRFTYLGQRGTNGGTYRPYNSNLLEYDRVQLDSMYLSDWTTGAVIDYPVEDMLREGRQIQFGEDEDKVKIYMDVESSFKVNKMLAQALKWSRLYGGAAIVLGIDGTGDPSLPLDLNRIKKGSLRWMRALDKWYISPQFTNVSNIEEKSYYDPTYYRITNSDITIHHSRIIKFTGVDVPMYVQAIFNFWGSSKMTRVYNALVNAGIVTDAFASLCLKSNLPVMKVPDLNNILSSEGGTARLRERIALAQTLASNQNVMLMDEKESYELITPRLERAAELIDKYLQIVSGASGIPVARLMGQASAGLNNTGEADFRNYYDGLKSQQINAIKPAWERIDEILLRHTFGEVPEDFKWEFNPLWQLSDAEQADLENKNAQRDQTYLNAGVITEAIVAKELQNNNTYSAIDDKYIQKLEGIQYENPKQDYEDVKKDQGDFDNDNQNS